MGHVAETHTRDAELGQHAAGATVDRVTAAQTHRRRVAGKLLQADASGFALLVGRVRVHELLLELEALGGADERDDLDLVGAGLKVEGALASN